MPRLVTDAMAVAARVGKVKPKLARAPAQPAIRRGAREMFVELDVLRRTDVERAPRVVFAEARRGDEAKDAVDGAAGREFLADEFGLPRDAPKTRERQQHDAVVRRGVAHFFPRDRRARREPDGLSIVRRGPDRDEAPGFAVWLQSARARIASRNAERAMNDVETRDTHSASVGAAFAPASEHAVRRGAFLLVSAE